MKSQNKFQTTTYVPAPVVSPYTDGTNLYAKLSEKMAAQEAKTAPQQYGWLPGASADKKATRKEIKAQYAAARAANAPSKTAPKSLLTDDMLSSTAMVRGAPVGKATLAKAAVLSAGHSIVAGIKAGASLLASGFVALGSSVKGAVVGLASATASGVSALLGFANKARIALFGATKAEKQKAADLLDAQNKTAALFAAELLPDLDNDELPVSNPVGSKLPLNDADPVKATKVSKGQFAAAMDNSVTAEKLNKILSNEFTAQAASVALPAGE